MLHNYLKIAWRNITRHRGYTLINTLGLALGISACLIIFLISSYELSYDKFHPDKERIYRVVGDFQDNGFSHHKMGFVLCPLPTALRNEISGFETVSSFFNYYAKVSIPDGGKTRRFEIPKMGEQVSDIIVADPQYFDIFKYQWLAGSAVTSLNEPFKVVLSEAESKKYFGSLAPDEAIGRRVVYNDSLVVVVTGIVKDWNKNTDLGFKDFISFSTIQQSFIKNDFDMTAWGMWEFNAQGYVKLAKGISPEQLEKQFPAFVKKHILMGPDNKAKAILSLQPLSDVHYNEDYADAYSRKTNLPTLYGLMCVALFILIIAVINFVNLSTAQSIKRSKEIGIRKVLGSNRGNIVFQFLCETFIITLLAVFLSLLISRPLLSLLHELIPGGVKLNPASFSTLVFLAAISIITTLLAGLYPAKVLSSCLPALNLKGRGMEKLNRKSYLHKGLIIFQFSFSLIFIIGTIIVTRQIHFILNKDLGFTKDAIITLRTSYNYPPGRKTVLAEKIRQMADVQIVSTHMETPAAKGHPGTFIKNMGTDENKVNASFDMCDGNYVPLFGLKIKAGRNVVASDSIREFLVNETCARDLGYNRPEDAIGKQVQIGMNDGYGPIVGVVGDFHSKSLHEAITPFFISSFDRAERDISIKLSTSGKGAGDFRTSLASINKLWKEIYPNEKFEYRFFDQTIANLYSKEQKTSRLMNLAMTIAIFISCMGLLGLVTFTAEQRTKEIGIRKVLGANIAGIVALLTRDFLWLVIISIIIASPVAYYFMRVWLQDFAYRTPISWWIFLLAGFAAIVIAMLTVSFQAFKAAIANPVDSLRSE
jgi:putative ABC transport system permease protein